MSDEEYALVYKACELYDDVQMAKNARAYRIARAKNGHKEINKIIGNMNKFLDISFSEQYSELIARSEVDLKKSGGLLTSDGLKSDGESSRIIMKWR
jgi:hypothetical protein